MGRYIALFKERGFHPFLWAQFLGAFNDNAYKIVISMVAVNLIGDDGAGGWILSLIGALFILPFFLFSGYAGHLADIYDKQRVLIYTKSFEIVAMSLAFFSLRSGEIALMLGVLFLMALQSTFFSPAKYGILPEIFPDKDLSRANGLLGMSTFLAIVLGTSFGSILFSAWKERLEWIAVVLIVVAVVGTVTSFGITKVPPSGARKPFRLNPWGEILHGVKRLYSEKPLWITVLGISYFWFLGALVQMDILLLGSETMGLDDLRIGLMVTFLAIGIGIGSLVTGRLSGDKVELGLVPLGSIGIGVFSIATFLSTRSYVAVVIFLILLGFSGGVFIVPLQAFLQQKSGREEKGLLISTNNFINTFGILLASGVFWLLRDTLQVRADQILLFSGLFTLTGTVYTLMILPDFLIRFSLWMLTHTVYRIRIEGEENLPFRGPALLVSNHISHVDGLLVGACVQRFIRFMIYKPYYEIRAIHWLFRLMKAIPVMGGDRREVIKSIERAREALLQGHVVCIFAEGAISRTGNMLPFKRGFERIVQGLDVPIIPVSLGRLWGSIFSFKGGRFFWKWPRKIPYPVTISFGRPLPSRSSAEAVRSTVMELGSEAVRLGRAKNDLLHLRFIRSAKKEWSRFCMADSTGKDLTYGKALISGLILSKKIRQRCPGQEMIGLLLPASVGGALANIAVLLSGKVPVNLNFTAGKESLDSVIRQCRVKTILTSKAFVTRVKIERLPEMVFLEEILQRIGSLEKWLVAFLAFLLPSRLIGSFFSPGVRDPYSLATVIFTSGSTGEPKGVMLSHHNILSNIEGISQIFWLSRKERVMGVLPFFHSFGFTGTLWFPLIVRCGAVYHTSPTDAKTVGEMVRRYQAAILISTPTFYAAYIQRCAPEAFSSVRYAIVGAEKLREQVADAFHEKFGLELLEGYGCTELGPVISANIPDVVDRSERQRGRSFGTVGHPIPGVAVKIVNPDTKMAVPTGQEGLLLVKGPNLMMGYLHQPEKTKAVIEDGWYDTGDIASIDENGFIRIAGRLSRFSKIGGEMVPHLKIEEAVNRIIGESGCAVTGVPDTLKGERLIVLYANNKLSPRDLWEQLRVSGLPQLWIPKQENIYYIGAIPTLGTGKTDLRKVKLIALERLGEGKDRIARHD